MKVSQQHEVVWDLLGLDLNVLCKLIEQFERNLMYHPSECRELDVMRVLNKVRMIG